MRVKELMNKNIIYAYHHEQIWEIAKKMKEYNIGFIPIVKESKIIGVITDRDIVINSISNNNDKNNSVDIYINKNIISIDMNREVHEALKLMAKNKTKRLIVTDDNKGVGIIALSDILSTNLDKEILTTIKSIWQNHDNKKIDNPQIDTFYL